MDIQTTINFIKTLEESASSLIDFNVNVLDELKSPDSSIENLAKLIEEFSNKQSDMFKQIIPELKNLRDSYLPNNKTD